MFRKLPGLIWTAALVALAVKRLVPPDVIAAVKEKVRAGGPTMPTDVPPPEGADLHTPMPVA
jgi:hypothetical protein